jgi:hypothetical protein
MVRPLYLTIGQVGLRAPVPGPVVQNAMTPDGKGPGAVAGTVSRAGVSCARADELNHTSKERKLANTICKKRRMILLLSC